MLGENRGTLIKALCLGLQDNSVLTQRNFLDFILFACPLNSKSHCLSPMYRYSIFSNLFDVYLKTNNRLLFYPPQPPLSRKEISSQETNKLLKFVFESCSTFPPNATPHPPSPTLTLNSPSPHPQPTLTPPSPHPHLPHHLGKEFSHSDLLQLLKAALSVLLRRDMSLNRRLYNWLEGHGADESNEQKRYIFRAF